MSGTPSPSNVSTQLHRIATLAREAPQRVFTALAHHLDVAFLREAFRRTRQDGAPGVDGQTAAAYAETLDTNLASLVDRLKAGTYIAPPVRRAYVPKEEGGKPCHDLLYISGDFRRLYPVGTNSKRISCEVDNGSRAGRLNGRGRYSTKDSCGVSGSSEPWGDAKRVE